MWPKKRFLLTNLALALFCCVLFHTPHTQASSLYVETGFGLGRMMGAKDFFGSTYEEAPFSFAGDLLMAFNFAQKQSILQLHLGVDHRYNMAGENLLMATYPLLRIETPRFYIGGGATPYVYRGTGVVGGYLAYMGQAGIIWRVVPFFHINAGGALQIVNGGPKPVFDAHITFRFEIFSNDSKKGSGREWDGWRYPFGIEVWND